VKGHISFYSKSNSLSLYLDKFIACPDRYPAVECAFCAPCWRERYGIGKPELERVRGREQAKRSNYYSSRLLDDSRCCVGKSFGAFLHSCAVIWGQCKIKERG